MKKNSLKILLALAFLTVCAVLPAWAEYSLSVRPYEGGYDLNFGKIGLAASGVNKELVINIRSDIGKQYRLIQSFFEPMVNARGESIPVQNTFFVYALRGTAKYGTLSVEQETPVSLSRTIIYTSNSQGASDSFTLVYSLKGPLDVSPGYYRGRVTFTLEAINSNQPPETVFLNTSCEVESSSYIQIKTPDGSNILRLKSSSPEARISAVAFNISGGLGRQYRIIQSIREPLRSSDGLELSEGSVVFQTEQIKNGSGPTQPTAITLRPETIYQSDLSGRPDNFIGNFILNDTAGNKAGIYKTGVSYFLEDRKGQEAKRLETYLLEVEIKKEFDLELKTESGGGVILFKDLGPDKPPRNFEIEVRVKSNLGKQYQVTQNVASGLVNKEGKSIPSNLFTLKTAALGETKGVLKCPQSTEVKPGDTVLFVSDKKGTADSFKTVYELQATQGVSAGDYSASVVYSLSEL